MSDGVSGSVLDHNDPRFSSRTHPLKEKMGKDPWLSWNLARVTLPCNLEEIPTPALLVDFDAVSKNCCDMIAKAKAAGVKLRPHMKTHKTIEIGKMQVQDYSDGIIVSTVAEVYYFAAADFRDITYGVPITASKLPFLSTIIKDFGVKINLMVDSDQQVDEIESHGSSFGAFLKIDIGYHRAGVDVAQDESRAIHLARRMTESKSIRFLGIYSHSGHGYTASNRDEAIKISDEECDRAAAFAQRLKDRGIQCPAVSVGGTPSCGSSSKFPGVTEIHPGNYVFYDRQQASVESCQFDQIAVSVLVRVLGHYEHSGHILCDAGSLGMSKDTSPQDSAFGSVKGHDLVLQSISQEVGKLVPRSGSGKKRKLDMESYPLGSLLEIVPNHSCLTAACHPLYYVVKDRKVVDVWVPCRGW